MSWIYLPEGSPDLPNGVRVCLVRANHLDSVHNTTVANELFRVITNDAKAHGVSCDGKGFEKVLEAFKKNKIQAYFLVVERENCLPTYAGGAIQFPTVVTEWNGEAFIHYPALYSEDTWVDRDISVAVRTLTAGTSAFPKGVGLGTLNTNGRIALSVSGGSEDMPYGMVARARISENASDNVRQLAILKKLNATLGANESGIYKFDISNNITQSVDIKICGFASKNGNGRMFNLLGNVFKTHWSTPDGSQQIVATHTEAISTTTGETIIRSQFMSNGNLPSVDLTREVVKSMIAAAREEAALPERGWTLNNESGPTPIVMAHAFEAGLVKAFEEASGEIRSFGSHRMVPSIVNYKNIVGFNAPAAKPLEVIEPNEAARSVKQGYEQQAYFRALAS